jgi:hypothetical protein
VPESDSRGTFVPHVDTFLVLVKPLFRLPRRKKDPLYHYGFTQLKEVLEMGVGVLVWFAVEWASPHHETRFEFKVHVPNFDAGSGGHIGGLGDGEVTKSLFSHDG